MIFFILKISILSFILIFVIHNILLYLQKTLTTPKLKDLVNNPNQQYKVIYETINNNSNNIDSNNTDSNNSNSNTNNSFNNNNNNIKSELDDYLNDVTNNSNSSNMSFGLIT